MGSGVLGPKRGTLSCFVSGEEMTLAQEVVPVPQEVPSTMRHSPTYLFIFVPIRGETQKPNREEVFLME